MLRKSLYVLIIVALLVVGLFPASSLAAVSSTVTFTPDLENGRIGVSYNASVDPGLKVRVMKVNSSESVFYDLKAGRTEYFPLQMGNGQYSVTVFQKVQGSSFRSIGSQNVELNLDDTKIVYLSSNQLINWNDDMAIIQKAQQLVVGIDSDILKARAIYEYMVRNYSYDYKKAATVQSGYIPNIEQIAQIRQGICYDYSAVYAAMLRSVGIPARLVKGYTSNFDGYHAWNEVWIEGRGWLVVDTTADAYYLTRNIVRNTMVQPAHTYATSSQF